MRLDFLRKRRERRELVVAAQRRADYPYCELGFEKCRSQTCGCVDSPLWRWRFRRAWLRRNCP